MATKYILDPSGKIIKADSGNKIDPVDPVIRSSPHYTEEVLKNISAKENENDNVFDSFLSNVRLGLLEEGTDQDRLTEYITSKVDQDPSFGFINEDGGEDYFVHTSGVVEQIKDGDAVEFELEEDQKGMRAVNVRPL